MTMRTHQKALCFTLAMIMILSMFSMSALADTASALASINAASAATLPDAITEQINNGESLGINATIYTNLTQVSKEALAQAIVTARPVAGFAAMTDFTTAYENALKNIVITVTQSMVGDIVFSTANNEAHFNGAGGDQTSKSTMVKFALSGDVNVDKEYILSVNYNLAVRTGSGNCEAKNFTQPWSFYLVDGNWQECRATYSSLGNIVTDTSNLLLTLNYKALVNNSFDITTGYKALIDDTKDVFAIRTDLAQYNAVFNTGSKMVNNYLTYVIDKNAIVQAINNAQTVEEVERLILKNGYAIGLDVGTYSNLQFRGSVNEALLNLDGADAQTIAATLKSAMSSLVGSTVSVTRTSQGYQYVENTTGQNLTASLVGKGTGALWSTDASVIKSVFVFDVSSVPKDYIASVKFKANRNGGGQPNGTKKTVSLYAADSSHANADPAGSMFYLNFEQVNEKYVSVDRNTYYYADVTDFAKTQTNKVYLGLTGIENDCFNSLTYLEYQYEYAAMLADIGQSNIAETKSILTKYGSMMGMTPAQLTAENVSKAALALAGRTISSLDEFKQMVATGIAQVSEEDVLVALNNSQDISEFKNLVSEFGSVMGIDSSLFTNLDAQTQENVMISLYNSGADYTTVLDFKNAYDEYVLSIYNNVLSGLSGVDVEQTKAFLTANGSFLGISAEDLTSKLEKLGLAFTLGRPLTDITEFKNIYADFENKAVLSVIKMINRANSAEEFDELLQNYYSYLGVDLRLYNKIPSKEGIFGSLKGATSTADSFKSKFNTEIEKYFATPVASYATDELMTSPSSTAPDFGAYQGWMGVKSETTHFIKYDLSNMNIDVSKLAKVTLKIPLAKRNDQLTQADKTYLLYSAGTNWKDNTDYYQTLLNKGVLDGQVLVAQKYEALLNGGDNITFDITDYILNLASNGQIGQLAFQFALQSGSIIINRQGDSTTYAPMEFTFIDSDGALVSYSPSSGSIDVPIAGPITIDFDKAVDAGTVNTTNIIVKKNSVALSGGYTVKLDGDKRVIISFANPLSNEAVYTVELSKNVKFVGDTKNYVFNSLTFTTEKIPFEFKGLTLSQNGTALTNLSQRTSPNINARAFLINNSVVQPKRIVMTVALYSKKNNITSMIDARTIVKTLSQGDSAVIDTPFVIPEEEGTSYMVSCYIWDSFTGMKRLFSQSIE